MGNSLPEAPEKIQIQVMFGIDRLPIKSAFSLFEGLYMNSVSRLS
jgi:hypothetical protein